MYNRYINADLAQPFEPPENAEPIAQVARPPTQFVDIAEPAPEPPAPPVPEKPKGLGSLKSLFGGNIKLPDFDADTILLLVLVYFLVADADENISDTLLIVGVLLLLGF